MYTITGTSQLLSVPYALFSADTAGLDLKADLASPTFTGDVVFNTNRVDISALGTGNINLSNSNGQTFFSSFQIFNTTQETNFQGGDVLFSNEETTFNTGILSILNSPQSAGNVLTDVNGDGVATWESPNKLLTTYEAASSAAVNPLSADVTGSLIYTQNSETPSFPENLPDGFTCTIINYSNFLFTSNVLTTALFVTESTGTMGSSSFTIPSGGTVNVYVMTNPGNGQKLYYIK